MSWYERARRFQFPKSDSGSGSKLGKGAANETDSPNPKPPLEKAPSQHLFRSATAPAGQPLLVLETVNCYNLDWSELRPFLEKKYPQLKFDEKQVGIEDHFLFRVPKLQPLTDEDRNKIDEIRAEHRARINPEFRRAREEHSPDPPPQRLVDDEEEDEDQEVAHSLNHHNPRTA